MKKRYVRKFLADAGFPPTKPEAPRSTAAPGCQAAATRGTKDGSDLYEVLEVTDELRELILVGASALELRKKAIEQGMVSLRRSGLIKVMAGLTTLEEVIRETML